MAEYCEKETIYLTLYNKLYDEVSRSAGERRDFCFEIMDQKLKPWCDGILTANVRENVRGEWIVDEKENPYGVDWCHCSVCGCKDITQNISSLNFCPNCGAEMRKEERHDRLDH